MIELPSHQVWESEAFSDPCPGPGGGNLSGCLKAVNTSPGSWEQPPCAQRQPLTMALEKMTGSVFRGLCSTFGGFNFSLWSFSQLPCPQQVGLCPRPSGQPALASAAWPPGDHSATRWASRAPASQVSSTSATVTQLFVK